MERFHWPCETPNVAGLLYAVLALNCIVAAHHLSVKRSSLRPLCAYAAIGAAGSASLLFLGCLSWTGSRAGILSFALALLIAWRSRLIDGRSSLLAAAAILGAVICTPVAGERIIRTVSADSSVDIRLQVWRAGIGLIGDHPWTGVGYGNYAKALNMWYLPSELSGRFATSLSDYLTLAGMFGLPLACLVSATALALLGVNLILGPARGATGRIRWASLASLAIIVVSGLFQGHLWAWPMVDAIALSFLLLHVVLVIRECRARQTPVRVCLAMLSCGLLSSACVALILLTIDARYPRERDLRTDLLSNQVMARHEAYSRIAIVHLGAVAKEDFLRRKWEPELLVRGWAMVIPSADQADPPGGEAPVPVVEIVHGEDPSTLRFAPRQQFRVAVNPLGVPDQASLGDGRWLVILTRGDPLSASEPWMESPLPFDRILLDRSDAHARTYIREIERWLSRYQ